MQSIAKLCADHIRAFSHSHGVKLKSSHAHELVAAFFGYKSKAAMQADTLFSIESLPQAKILVLMPSLFIEQRRQCLEELPLELPDTYTLGEELFIFLASKEMLKEVSDRVFPSWAHLAETLTKEYLQNNGDLILSSSWRPCEKARDIFNRPLYEFSPQIETTTKGLKLTVTNKYSGSQNVNFQSIDVTVTIELQRIAGHVGYLKADISLIKCSTLSELQTGG